MAQRRIEASERSMNHHMRVQKPSVVYSQTCIPNDGVMARVSKTPVATLST